jgi:hypothetical protein
MLLQEIQSWLNEERTFDEESEEIQHTDVDKAWDLLYAAEEIFKKLV